MTGFQKSNDRNQGTDKRLIPDADFSQDSQNSELVEKSKGIVIRNLEIIEKGNKLIKDLIWKHNKIQLEQLYEGGVNVFGTKYKFEDRLVTINLMSPYNGKSPIELITDEQSLQEMIDQLGRFQYGIFS